MFELENALKFLEVQCKFQNELYMKDPENKVQENEERKIREKAEEIRSKLNERLNLIQSTLPKL